MIFKSIILGAVVAIISGFIPNDIVTIFRVPEHFQWISYAMDKTVTGYGFILPWKLTFDPPAMFIGSEYYDFITLIINIAIFSVIFYGYFIYEKT